MMRSLFSAVSGLKSNQTAMDVIGNNIANVNTIGYKSSRTVFQDIFSQTISNATAPTATTGGRNAMQVGLGTSIAAIGMNMTEGSTQQTSNPLDFAIEGEGFFVVKDSNGAFRYTRNGAFLLDKEGYLVTANGDYVMAVATEDDTYTPNVIPADLANGQPVDNTSLTRIQFLSEVTTVGGDTVTLSSYSIDNNGYIKALNEDGAPVTIGRLVLANFNNPAGLEKVGSSYYRESSNSGEVDMGFVGDKRSGINSGSLEMSNVDLSTELTNMIITQRGFQANSRVITTTDTMLEELINLKR
jgi:flagellar hook protein FlgE